MKNTLVIYTGGTIGMVPTANGYSPSPGVFRAALDAIGEMHHPDMPRWDFLELDPILDSSNIAVAKLYYLFSKGLGLGEIKSAMEHDICGELTP